MYQIMRIVDGPSGETFFMAGHDRDEAVTAFGEDIEVKNIVAVEAKYSDQIDDIIDAAAEQE